MSRERKREKERERDKGEERRTIIIIIQYSVIISFINNGRELNIIIDHD